MVPLYNNDDMTRKKVLSTLITVLILAIFAHYIFNHPNVLAPLSTIPLWMIVIIAAMKVCALLVRALFFRVLLQPFNKNLKIQDGFFASFITTFGNFFLPMQSGAGLRALYFKRLFSFPYTKFLSTLSGIFILTFFVNSILGITSLLVLYRPNEPTIDILLGFFVFLLLTTVFLGTIRIKTAQSISHYISRLTIVKPVMTHIENILQGWATITENPLRLVQLSILILVDITFLFVGTFLELNAINVHIGLLSLILYLTVTSITILINITPGAIGIKEGLLIIFSSVIGLTNDQVLQVAVIDRGILFLTLLVLFLIYFVAKPTIIRDLIQKPSR